MAFDKKVLIDTCRSTATYGGHDFQSMIVGMVKVPHPEQLMFINEYRIICTNCGATPEEASAEMRPSRTRKEKKVPAQADPALTGTPEPLE